MGKINSRDDRKKISPPSPANKSPFFWLALLMIVGLFLLPWLFNTSPEGKEISWLHFKTRMLDSAAVDKLVVVNNERVSVFIKKKSSMIHCSVKT